MATHSSQRYMKHNVLERYQAAHRMEGKDEQLSLQEHSTQEWHRHFNQEFIDSFFLGNSIVEWFIWQSFMTTQILPRKWVSDLSRLPNHILCGVTYACKCQQLNI